MQTPNINFSVSPRLESNFIDSYCVLFEFEKRASVNMQEINLKFWIMGCTTEGAIGFIFCLLKNLLSEIIEERIDTALPYMKISDIQEKIILIPPQPILQHFHSLVEPLFQKITLNQKQIMVLRKIRDALLPKLVFGRLRVEEI